MKLRIGIQNGLGLSSGKMEDGKFIPVSQTIAVLDAFGIRHAIERHSVELCQCSFCYPTGPDWKRLPHIGRFEVTVPPKRNRWKWTHFSLRIGKWQYFYLLPWQILPSTRPWCKLERWDAYGNYRKASDETLSSLALWCHIMGQEAAFGHKPKFSESVADLVDIPLEDLTEDEAQRLIEDAKSQHRKMMEEESTR